MASRMDQVDSKVDVDTESNAMADWDYIKVAKIIHDALGSKVDEKWRHLARRLKVNEGQYALNLERIRKSLLLDKKEPLDVIEEVVEAWKNNNGEEATIYVLVKELRKIDCVEASEKLAAAYGIPNLH